MDSQESKRLIPNSRLKRFYVRLAIFIGILHLFCLIVAMIGAFDLGDSTLYEPGLWQDLFVPFILTYFPFPLFSYYSPLRFMPEFIFQPMLFILLPMNSLCWGLTVVAIIELLRRLLRRLIGTRVSSIC